MIAMALANRPDLFIADEPTTALDVTVQAQILKLLKDLQAKLGMAMLFITHDLGIVRKHRRRRRGDAARPDRRGRAETAEVFADPQHPYTRMLLAAEPKGEPPPLDATRAGRSSRPTTSKSGSRSSKGFLRRTVGHVKAVDGVSVDRARGPDGRRRRRIRLGQDDARPGDPAPHPLGRADRLLRPAASTGSRVKADAPAAARHADRLSGPLRLAVAAPVGRRDRRGGADRAENASSTRPSGARRSRARSPTPASIRRAMDRYPA